VTFAVGASDIHRYGDSVLVQPGLALTGIWGADGRETDPATTLDTDPRTAALDPFLIINPNGRWTLFIADVVSGGEARLDRWGLEWTAGPGFGVGVGVDAGGFRVGAG